MNQQFVHCATAEEALLRAETLLAERSIAEATACFDQAERMGAHADRCASGRWHCLMLTAAYGRAWLESDAIRARGAYDPHRYWNGSSLRGRVLMRSLHGFGDAVQYLRYAPLVRARAERLIVQASPRLLELLRYFPSIDCAVPWGEEPAWDMQIEVTELPYIFRSTPATLPRVVPYLYLPADLGTGIESTIGRQHKPRVGLVWTGGEWDSSRSIPFRYMRELLFVEGVEFWSLQESKDNQEWSTFCSEQNWPERTGGEHSIEHLAAFIREMDLIVTVDSLAAHLAGAIGKPVWVMLKQRADWRWMLERSDSPWYPTMRLFRQPLEGDWLSVIRTIQAALNTSYIARSTSPALFT